MRRLVAATVVAGAMALLAGGCGDAVPESEVTVDAAGPLPSALARAWSARTAEATGARVRVRPAGSAGAVRALGDGTAVFAIVGEPLGDRRLGELTAASETVPLHVPLVLSPIAIGYELKKWGDRDISIASGIKLDTATLAVMLRAQIWSWISERILGRNELPEAPDEIIQTCQRSDPSVAEGALTGYLSRRSAWWREGVGSGEDLRWEQVNRRGLPLSHFGRGDDGMVRCLKNTSASLGYLDAADANRAGISVARISNRAGGFVSPTVAGAQAAAASAVLPADLRLSALDPPGRHAYPVTAVRHALVPPDLCAAGADREEAAAAKAWLALALEEGGQRTARRLGYAPLPERIRAASATQVERLSCDGTPID